MKEYICKKKCGYCCTLRVRLRWRDILRILLHTGYGYRGFVRRDSDRQKVLRMNGRKCYFLTKKNGKAFCVIYNYRPEACRVFPFFNEDIKSCEEIKRFNRRFSRSL